MAELVEVFDANRDPAKPAAPSRKQTPAEIMAVMGQFATSHPPLKVVSGGH